MSVISLKGVKTNHLAAITSCYWKWKKIYCRNLWILFFFLNQITWKIVNCCFKIAFIRLSFKGQQWNSFTPHQHSQSFFLAELPAASVILIFCGLASLSPRFFLMLWPSSVKISEIQKFSFAELSRNWTPYFLARASPSALETWRSESATSDLLPTMILEMCSGWL